MEKTRKVFRYCHSLANKPFDYQFKNTLTWTTIVIEHWTLGAVWMNQKCNSKWHTVVTHKTNDSVCWVTIKSHFYIFHVWIFSGKYILENRPRVKLSLGKRQRDSEGSKKRSRNKNNNKIHRQASECVENKRRLLSGFIKHTAKKSTSNPFWHELNRHKTPQNATHREYTAYRRLNSHINCSYTEWFTNCTKCSINRRNKNCLQEVENGIRLSSPLFLLLLLFLCINNVTHGWCIHQ